MEKRRFGRTMSCVSCSRALSPYALPQAKQAPKPSRGIITAIPILARRVCSVRFVLALWVCLPRAPLAGLPRWVCSTTFPAPPLSSRRNGRPGPSRPSLGKRRDQALCTRPAPHRRRPPPGPSAADIPQPYRSSEPPRELPARLPWVIPKPARSEPAPQSSSRDAPTRDSSAAPARRGSLRHSHS